MVGGKTCIYSILPEHSFKTHISYSDESPEQKFPSTDGGGSVQLRCLCLIPCPHELLHDDQSYHAVQPPCTENEKKNISPYLRTSNTVFILIDALTLKTHLHFIWRKDWLFSHNNLNQAISISIISQSVSLEYNYLL